MIESKSPLLTDHETAALFGISRPTLWRWRKDVPNFPQPVKLGPRAVRYRRSDLDAFIAAAAQA